MTNGDNRSVTAGGNITGSINQTGDRNRAELIAVQLPKPDAVDIKAALAELRAVLAALATEESGKIGRALEDAEEEAAKASPDKQEVAGVLTRALRLAEKAGNFSEHVGKIRSLVTDIGGWIGAASPYVAPLLATVGLSAA